MRRAWVFVGAVALAGRERASSWCEEDYRELLWDVGAAGHATADPASWFRDVVRLAFLDFLDGGADGSGRPGEGDDLRSSR